MKLPSDLFLETYAPVQNVALCEFIKAHQAVSFFDFWEALENELSNQCIPFWGAVWPAAKSLAKYIWNNKDLVYRKKVLDFGCGSGIVSIASALSGASRVLANDIDPVALYVAGKNFLINHVNAEIEPRNLLENQSTDSFDIIFVVDMFYEKSISDKLIDYLHSQIGKGADVIIADGGRPFVPKKGLVQLFKEDIDVDKSLEGINKRTVRLLRLTSA